MFDHILTANVAVQFSGGVCPECKGKGKCGFCGATGPSAAAEQQAPPGEFSWRVLNRVYTIEPVVLGVASPVHFNIMT
jgi:hypothetical protein